MELVWNFYRCSLLIQSFLYKFTAIALHNFIFHLAYYKGFLNDFLGFGLTVYQIILHAVPALRFETYN